MSGVGTVVRLPGSSSYWQRTSSEMPAIGHFGGEIFTGAHRLMPGPARDFSIAPHLTNLDHAETVALVAFWSSREGTGCSFGTAAAGHSTTFRSSARSAAASSVAASRVVNRSAR